MQCYRSVLPWQNKHHSVLNILKSSIFSSKLLKINIHINKNVHDQHLVNTYQRQKCTMFQLYVTRATKWWSRLWIYLKTSFSKQFIYFQQGFIVLVHTNSRCNISVLSMIKSKNILFQIYFTMVTQISNGQLSYIKQHFWSLLFLFSKGVYEHYLQSLNYK